MPCTEYITEKIVNKNGGEFADVITIRKLDDTVGLMIDADYRNRFKGEYYQLKIRYEKLKAFCNKIEAAIRLGTEEPKHDIPLEMLRHQQAVMGEYLHILEIRAVKENIDL